MYGITKTVNNKLTFVKVKHYPADQVNPPEGVKSADWIRTSLKPAGK